MTDTLFHMGLSNACVALILAVVAMAVGASGKRPHLAHMLWLLVFVKLVTPPLVMLPVVTLPAPIDLAASIEDASGLASAGLGEVLSELGVDQSTAQNRSLVAGEGFSASLVGRIGFAVFGYGKTWFPLVWLVGSVGVFGWSLLRRVVLTVCWRVNLNRRRHA